MDSAEGVNIPLRDMSCLITVYILSVYQYIHGNGCMQSYDDFAPPSIQCWLHQLLFSILT